MKNTVKNIRHSSILVMDDDAKLLNALEKVLAECLRLGVADFPEKPLEIQQLLTAIDKTIMLQTPAVNS